MVRHRNNVHLGHRSHGCDYCDKAFTEAFKLRTHVVKKHLDRLDQVFECLKCSMKFMTGEQLVRHSQVP